jgi:Ca-activated chloride channel homolog
VSPLAPLLTALLAGAAPFVAEQPRVKEGNEKLLSGDAAAALERYQQAEREAGPRPEIDFDRGNALHAQGRHAEAREAWRKALEADQAGALSSRALQNMGTALDAEGDREGAARAMAEALRRDPANEDARYNLEVLLRRQGAGKGKPKDEGQDGPKQQEPAEPKERGPAEPRQGQGPQPAQPKDQQGSQPGPDQRPDPGQDERRRAGEDQRREQGKQDEQAHPGERQAGAEGLRPDAIGKQDAEKLLDAMRARERNMPLGPAGRKDGRKREVARDW